MNTLTMAERVEEYLAYRRALGYQIRVEGRMLQSFACYADTSGHRGPLTSELALRWARLPEQGSRLYKARRLEVVRTLARYLACREPGTEIPLRGLLGPAHARRPAFLYSEADITALIRAAQALTPKNGLRPRTYAALIGLLACTGLRIAEALALRADDLDWERGVLTVRHTKFHKSRLVPLDTSVSVSVWK
jgi:integrase